MATRSRGGTLTAIAMAKGKRQKGKRQKAKGMHRVHNKKKIKV